MKHTTQQLYDISPQDLKELKAAHWSESKFNELNNVKATRFELFIIHIEYAFKALFRKHKTVWLNTNNFQNVTTSDFSSEQACHSAGAQQELALRNDFKLDTSKYCRFIYVPK